MEKRVYQKYAERGARLLLLLAVRDLLPGAKVRFEHSIGEGVYVTVTGAVLTPSVVSRLDAYLQKLRSEDLPIRSVRWTKEQAMQYFAENGQPDTVHLLRYRPYDFFDVHTCDGLSDYFYGQMPESTSRIPPLRLSLHYPGLILQFHDDPFREHEYPKLMRTFADAQAFSHMLNCENVADINDVILKGGGRELIRICESLHTRKIAAIAQKIVETGAQAVFIAGPSSSGKTTFTNRLGVELRVCGKRPVMISLDNYYVGQDQTPLDEEGNPDYECLESLDVPLFNEHLLGLLGGREVELPLYSFEKKAREPIGIRAKLSPDEVLLVEGIHGLNGALSADIPAERKFRIYVSALTQLNLDDHNFIHTSDLRLLRRIVRDARTRNTSAAQTIAMWDKVGAGEQKYIFPYQEEADVMFNSSELYELSVLKKTVYPLLKSVPDDSPSAETADSLRKFLHYFADCPDTDEIPPTSILREFIGGCSFYGEKA